MNPKRGVLIYTRLAPTVRDPRCPRGSNSKIYYYPWPPADVVIEVNGYMSRAGLIRRQMARLVEPSCDDERSSAQYGRLSRGRHTRAHVLNKMVYIRPAGCLTHAECVRAVREGAGRPGNTAVWCESERE